MAVNYFASETLKPLAVLFKMHPLVPKTDKCHKCRNAHTSYVRRGQKVTKLPSSIRIGNLLWYLSVFEAVKCIFRTWPGFQGTDSLRLPKRTNITNMAMHILQSNLVTFWPLLWPTSWPLHVSNIRQISHNKSAKEPFNKSTKIAMHILEGR